MQIIGRWQQSGHSLAGYINAVLQKCGVVLCQGFRLIQTIEAKRNKELSGQDAFAIQGHQPNAGRRDTNHRGGQHKGLNRR
ncbi:hypothetical protein MCAMS1_02814 [biofilm metagenome]